MLLAERLRELGEREVVQQVLQAAMRVQVRGPRSCLHHPHATRQSFSINA